MTPSPQHNDAQDSQEPGAQPTHPGAAFGIPEGATGEEVIDAVFGDGSVEGTEALQREIAAQQAGGIAGIEGIAEDLLPYLEAADEDGEALVGADGSLSLAEVREAGLSEAERQALEEARDQDALRELVAGHMIASVEGVDSLDALEELLADIDEDDSDDWDEWEPILPDTLAGATQASAQSLADEIEEHQSQLREAAEEVELAARLKTIEQEILSRAPEHKVQPSLERVEAVLDLLGNPEQTYRSVHITGTNGKTSTARMVEALLGATGMRTGRFTSPHLASIRERISLEGEPISTAGFIAAWEDVAPYIEMVDERSLAEGGPRLSFFEVLTVMALAAFADHPVDVAVIEVGMGGTWDSTNVIPGDVAVITPIGRDHEAWLGSTLEEIAENKAGIIKDGATLITAAQPAAAQAVIARAAVEHGVIWRREISDDELGLSGSPSDGWSSAESESVDADSGIAAGVGVGTGELEVLDRSVAVGGQLVTLRTAAATYEDVFVPLHGEYQAHNALLALAAAEAIFAGRALPAKIVEDGFAAATSPGRFEVLRSSPTVIVDAAHNVHGVEALLPAIEEVYGFSHMVAVVSVMADKDAEGILAALEPATDAVVVVPMDSPRAMEIEDLEAVAREVYGKDRVVVAEDLSAGVDQAVSISEGFDAPMTASGVLILGSVVLAADARALFRRS